MTDDFQWSGDADGLELGLSVRPHAVRAGEAIEVRFAVRNNAARALSISRSIALFVKRGDLVEEQFGGPTFTEDMPIPHGETLELLTWRLTTEQLGTAPGARTLWAVHRPTGGTEVRTGEVDIEVTA